MGDFFNFMMTSMLSSCMGTTATESTESSGSSWYVIVIYIVIFAAIIYFLMIRPQRKEKKKQEATMSQLQPGDSILTTSGFYGTIVAVNNDTIIVEFGNNKNCRIPMSKQAISQVEKANQGVAAAASSTGAVEEPNRKKFFGRKNAVAEEEAQAKAEAAAAKAESAKTETIAEAETTIEDRLNK